LNPLRTEVAATVFAEVTQALALTPSVTPVPSLTPTIAHTSTPTRLASASPSLQATITSGTPVTGTINLAAWVSQSIPDGTIFDPGETFTMTWNLKNVGTSTWTVSYLLRFYSGDAFGAPTEILLGRAVLPGETVAISIPMKAPTRPGDYRSDWVMADEARANFKQPVFLKITVLAPPTSTPTPTRTPTTDP
jgi:hypothetical protein